MDAAGNLYGTCFEGGAHGYGTVFELAYSNGSWILTDLHDFNGTDGRQPEGSVAFDSSGNLYGTTYTGGSQDFNCMPEGCGTVWEITGLNRHR